MSPTKGAGTGIPRFSSKLPAPRTAASTSLPPPAERSIGLKSPSKPAVRSSVNLETPSKPASSGIPSSHNKRSSIIGPGFIAPRPPSAQAVQKRPVSPYKSSVILRPGSRLAQSRPRPLSIVRPTQPEQEDVNDQLGSLDGFRTTSSIGYRDQSPDPEPEPEASSPFIEDATPKPRKASRPSLSDRTVESLSQLPATPATDRRRSGFFNEESPMVSPMGPPSRPASAMSVPRRLGTSDAGFAKPAPRLASPSKRPVSAIIQPSKRASVDYSKATPARRAVSSSMPRPSLGATTTPSFSASVRGGKPPVPTQAASRASIRPPSSASKALPTSVSKATTTSRLTKSGIKPPPKPITTAARPASSASTQTVTSSRALPQTDGTADSPTSSPSKSSATLREQIAKAKAAKRAANVPSASSTPTSTGGFDLDIDPFNQRPKDNKGVLRKRIEAARADGRLNIAAMGLTEIPDEVLRMYDADQVANSNVSWNESVDLARFMAADNQFETISDEVFLMSTQLRPQKMKMQRDTNSRAWRCSICMATNYSRSRLDYAVLSG